MQACATAYSFVADRTIRFAITVKVNYSLLYYRRRHPNRQVTKLVVYYFRIFIFQYISRKMQLYTVYFIWKLLYMFRVVIPPFLRSAYNYIYSTWYLSHRYCYLPLSWKSWNCTEVPTLPPFTFLSYAVSKLEQITSTRRGHC